jgi:iron complex transport system substrate-binding protein
MKKSIAHIAFTAFFIGAICFYGCGEKSKDRPADNIVWIKNQYATLFRVGYTTTDSFLELLSDPQTQKSVGRFFWGRSESVRGYQKITDRHRIVSLSAIHTGMLTELNAHVDLVGVESKKYIAHPLLSNNSLLKTLNEVDPDGPTVPEKLALCNPGILFGSITSLDDKQTIERLGKDKFAVLWCNNHLENHPLGRAEWLIAMGWAMGKSSVAQATFNAVRTDYEKWVTEAKKNTKISPKVIVNCVYNGMWFVPQNASYMAQFIRDAGGKPITAAVGSGSNVVSIEKAITLFREADIWINTDLCNSMACLKSSDPRVVYIKAFREGKAYHFNKQLQPNGSNPYWDMGCIYPNRILGDLFHIFRGDFNSDSSNYYDICK